MATPTYDVSILTTTINKTDVTLTPVGHVEGSSTLLIYDPEPVQGANNFNIGGKWGGTTKHGPPPHGMVIPAYIRALVAYRFGDPTTLLLYAVGRTAGGSPVIKTAFWPAIGFTPNVDVMEKILTDEKFTDKAVHVTGDERTGKSTEIVGVEKSNPIPEGSMMLNPKDIVVEFTVKNLLL